METPGNLFVVAAPSGAGKSSLIKALLELDSHLVVSVSHTTRAPRGQEQHGREYWFVDEPEFRAMVERGEFFEWAQVHGKLYGTSRLAIQDKLTRGEDVVLEIDAAFAADTFFPPWNRDEFELVDSQAHTSPQGLRYRFTTWRRLAAYSPKPACSREVA